MELELQINGVITSLQVEANETLLSLLRREGYYGIRQGCETGDCGACTVVVDGVARSACVMLAAQAGGCSLTTVEGLPSAQGLSTLQRSFVEVGAAPCGFCSSGMLLSAYALLQRNNHPSDDEVREALSGNLCRCGGYEKPVQAVLRAAALLHGEEVEEVTPNVVRQSEQNPLAALGMDRQLTANGATDRLPVITSGMSANADTEYAIVGKSLPMYNAAQLVSGTPTFVTDIERRGMLHARLLTSPHAHAVIRDIDVAEARAVSGVHAVLTYKDVSRSPYSSVERGLLESGPYDQFLLDYVLRYAGDRVALVVAESPEIAEEALGLIQVEYEVKPALLDPRQALEQNAPRVHPESEARGIFDAAHNIATRVRNEVGDVDKGFEEADVIVEGEYIVPMAQPAPLETHRVVTYIDADGVLVVRTNTQSPHHVRRTLARLLNLPLRKVRVIRPEVGGGFGSKQAVVLEDLCALATQVTGRPVTLAFSRSEEFTSGPVWPNYIIRLKTGVKQDGKLVANQMALLTSTGAYATHPLTAPEGVVSQALSLYPCANMRYVAEVLYTNTPPSSALRGYSSAQEAFALESHLDEIARRLRLDALELRRRNWLRTGDELVLAKVATAGQDVGSLLVESSGLAECLRLVEEKLGWHIKRGVVNNGRLRRGVGVALTMQGSPLPPASTSGATMKLNEDGSFDVFVGAGSCEDNERTLLAQVAAETLGVALESIVIYTEDTAVTPTAIGEGVTSTLYLGGGAVRKAAEQMRRQILAIAGRMLNALPESLKMSDGLISGAGEQDFTVAQVAAYALYVENRQLMTSASWRLAQVPLTFAVVGAEVEVDTETGGVRVEQILAAVDAGRVINPLLTETRIQGSLAQGLGSALSEELLYDAKGQPLTKHLGDYHLYNAVDMPRTQVYLVETTEPAGPFGAKAVSEVAMGAVAPAIANAVASATGIRLPSLPLTPERILRAWHAQLQAQAQAQSPAQEPIRS
ncbi:molybdopterin-dependent oxidoreductase [Ktedonobacter racemifer]|uniref:Aldehyde oxidase and xanthine dehydrogenase molybdopterin binding n=1 Tax=Ktedonobacter racemifer DSM 44963 TaxID=485913 RepID=D6TLK4_KTERA|nr:molybdopterin cofactor-binding domain-containing protein [Ktedonobacter racemifer]EFH86654.1 aldehyde oxidase and xanthine dehydrogenase molybdopterin binding [Ktedonobacter racemifer DSM 44963]